MKRYLGRLLLVDDDEETVRFWTTALKEEGFLVESAFNIEQMKENIKKFSFDIILLDLELDSESGLDELPYLLAETLFAKVFILTGHGSIESAVRAMEKGASGYVTKDMSPREITEQILLKLEDDTPYVTNQAVKEVFQRYGLIGNSKPFQELCSTIEQVKKVDSTVLILGETGTGKEIIARTIHALSNRSHRRFEAINCAAIPENLLESELFGHKRGAFTDAKTNHKGIFELCSDGTLLLDEIGDMPMVLQTKILRVLQERTIAPVGSSSTLKIDTRVIAATHRDPIEEIESGRFRGDLFFRLSVVPVHVPPLRHRKEDIPLLVNHFLKIFNDRFERDIGPPRPEVINRLVAYDWPGNIRELRNAIERAVVLATSSELSLKDIFQHLHKTGMVRQFPNYASTDELRINKIFELPLTEAKQAFEKSYVEFYLEQKKGNITEVAKKAGRYRVDVYRLIEKYGINPNHYR